MTAEKTGAAKVEAGSVLDGIVAEVRAGLPARQAALPSGELERRARAAREPRDFVAVLRTPGVGLVAEVKRGSPAKGAFAPELDAAEAARTYRDAGAVAISVLTSPHFFASDGDLEAVAGALVLEEKLGSAPPVLRKEFHVDPYQVLEARALGADAYLLIAKALEAGELRPLIEAGRSLGMTAFVEVTDEEELVIALEAGAPAIGINNRDLHTFSEDLGTTERLRPLVPSEIAVVAASGVRSSDDMRRMKAAGVDAVLIGEALSTAADPAATILELLDA